MTLRSHLITLVLVAVLPLLLFSAIVVGLAADSERDATERGLRATGRAVSSAIDHTLDNAIGALEVLATSELLDGGDLPGFHNVAARALEGQRGWLSVAVVDGAGRQVLNTLRPTGAELPPPADARTVAAVLARRLPIVSDLIAGDLPARAHVVVAVPVLRGRALRGALLTALDAHNLARVLEAQQLPHQWAAAIVDGHGVVVARVPEPQRFVGQPATAAYVALTARGDSGAARVPGLDGVRRHTVFNRLENAGWTVYLAIPTVTMDAGFRRSLVTLIGGGLVFLAAGLALAIVVGRRLTAPIVALSTAAARLGAGQLPDTPPGSRVAEVAALGGALTDAARRGVARAGGAARRGQPAARVVAGLRGRARAPRAAARPGPRGPQRGGRRGGRRRDPPRRRRARRSRQGRGGTRAGAALSARPPRQPSGRARAAQRPPGAGRRDLRRDPGDHRARSGASRAGAGDGIRVVPRGAAHRARAHARRALARVRRLGPPLHGRGRAAGRGHRPARRRRHRQRAALSPERGAAARRGGGGRDRRVPEPGPRPGGGGAPDRGIGARAARPRHLALLSRRSIHAGDDDRRGRRRADSRVRARHATAGGLGHRRARRARAAAGHDAGSLERPAHHADA